MATLPVSNTGVHTTPQNLAQLQAALARIERALRNDASTVIDIRADVDDLLGALKRKAIADEALTIGDVVRIASEDHIEKADASALATADIAGVMTESVASGAIGEYTAAGVVVRPDWALTPGAEYFLSAVTPGLIVTAPDSAAVGAVVAPVGRTLEATDALLVEVGRTILL